MRLLALCGQFVHPVFNGRFLPESRASIAYWSWKLTFRHMPPDSRAGQGNNFYYLRNFKQSINVIIVFHRTCSLSSCPPGIAGPGATCLVELINLVRKLRECLNNVRTVFYCPYTYNMGALGRFMKKLFLFFVILINFPSNQTAP